MRQGERLPEMERTAALMTQKKSIDKSELVLAADVLMNLAEMSRMCGESESAELMDTAFRMVFRLAGCGAHGKKCSGR